eukprot:TRINITY_DN23030_c0_g1_i11.p1 TRINITY_DN23030_c0_g1~~TRINITY_DN23030_c0_g1_i11.p1  ORF type:complete len:754 (-),score=93.36 TRINITY_DN23030_c0_g1_i11:204-2465(-)
MRRTGRKRKRNIKSEDFEYTGLLGHGGGHNKENEGLPVPAKVYLSSYKDTKAQFYFRGKNKGEKSSALAADLYEDNEKPVSVSVCTICYAYFPLKDDLLVHMSSEHQKARNKIGKHYVNPTTYHCPKCDKDISVKHIIWFVKHLKFCGQDDEKAQDILGPDDKDMIKQSQQNENFENEEDEDRLGSSERPRTFVKLAQLLLGHVNTNQIWGCRTCYNAFSSKAELEEHRNNEHQGVLRHGSCYDPASKQYTCLHCNTVIKVNHLVQFIKHVKQCLVDPSIGLAKDHEEEGLEDDTTEDKIDPWGIVNKPLRVTNLRSEWVCEALLGRIVPILYPCHVCYTAFPDEKSIKDHFSTSHGDTENCVENGQYYDKLNDVYNCPVCKRDVCKNQRSSIYFTYHLRKCMGKDFPVSKACNICGMNFNVFRLYLFHTKTSCEKQDFICHICSMHLKTSKDLTNHVQYVHTDARPFVCTACSKTFKRKGDLVIHEQSHNANMEYSCEHCGKTFNLKKNLKRHIQTHSNIQDRPHKCPHCYLRFIRKQVLDNHIATHTTLRKFSCEICGVKVKTRDALKAHRKKLHKDSGPLPSKLELEQNPHYILPDDNATEETPIVVSSNAAMDTEQRMILPSGETAMIVRAPPLPQHHHHASTTGTTVMSSTGGGTISPTMIPTIAVETVTSTVEGGDGVPTVHVLSHHTADGSHINGGGGEESAVTLTEMKSVGADMIPAAVKEEVIISQFQTYVVLDNSNNENSKHT